MTTTYPGCCIRALCLPSPSQTVTPRKALASKPVSQRTRSCAPCTWKANRDRLSQGRCSIDALNRPRPGARAVDQAAHSTSLLAITLRAPCTCTRRSRAEREAVATLAACDMRARRRGGTGGGRGVSSTRATEDGQVVPTQFSTSSDPSLGLSTLSSSACAFSSSTSL